MGQPTSDNGIPRPCVVGCTTRCTRISGLARGLRIANAMLGFGLPLSNGSMRSLNKIGGFKLTRGTETSQYPEERTSTETPVVVASEPGPGQGCRDIKLNVLGSTAIVGDSPVSVK